MIMTWYGTALPGWGQSSHPGFTLFNATASSCGEASGTITVQVTTSFPGGGFVYLQKSTNQVNWTQVAQLGEILFDVNPTNQSFVYHFSGLTQNTYYRAVNGSYATNSSLISINNVGSPASGTIQGLGNGKFCSEATVNLSLQGYGYANASLNNNLVITWKGKPIDIFDQYITISAGSSCSFNAAQYTQVFAEVTYTSCNYTATTPIATIESYNPPSAGTIASSNSELCTNSPQVFTLSSNIPLNHYNIVKWQVSSNNGASWSDINHTNNSLTVVPNTLVPHTTYQYRIVGAHKTYQGCLLRYSSATSISTRTTVPAGIDAGIITSNTPELCVGAPSNFVLTSNINTQDFTIARWQVSTNNGQSWSNINHTTSVLNVSPATLTPNTTYQYRVQGIHKDYVGCDPVNSGSVAIQTISTTPSNISVGSINANNTTLCSDPATSALLSFDQSLNDYTVIKWQVSENNGASWTDIAHTQGALSITSEGAIPGTNRLYRVVTEHNNYRGCSQLYSNSIQIQILAAPPAPTVSQVSFVCFGAGPITVSVNTDPSTTAYQWVGYSPNITDPSLHLDYVSADKTIEVKGINAEGCISVPASIQIIVMPKPVLQVSWKYQSNGHRLYTLSVADIYDQYEWFKDGIAIANANQATYQTAVDGEYRLKITYQGAVYELTRNIVTQLTIAQTKLNKVHEEIVRAKGIKNTNAVDGLSVITGQKSENIQYLDGLGRPFQAVQKQNSPATNDVVQPIVYDELGRNLRSLLPYTVSNTNPGEARSNASLEVFQFYNNTAQANVLAQTQFPYTETLVENSMVDKVIKQLAPGESWVGANQGVMMNYLVNPDPQDAGTAATDKIRILQVANVLAQSELTIDREEWILYSLENDNQGQLLTEYKARNRIVLQKGFSIPSSAPAITLEINAGDQNKPIVAGYYQKGELSKTRVTDEDGKVTEEFKNKSGQVILKRAQVTGDTWAQTYYAYDDFGQLSYVLPPEAVKTLEANNWDFTNATVCAEVSRLWYRYYYDTRGRTIIKEVPGTGKVTMVYDKRDRLVLSQDANQRQRNEWSFTKYDALNRPVITGIYPSSQTRTQLQAALDANFGAAGYAAHENFDLAQTNNHLYTDGSFPQIEGVANVKVHSVTYYDHYDWKSAYPGYDYDKQGGLANFEAESLIESTLGLVTATKTKILGSTATDPYLTTASYYDRRGRVAQTVADNHLTGSNDEKGKDRVMTQYAFDGLVEQSVVQHYNAANSITHYVTQWTEYDHTGRILKTYQEVQEGGTYAYKDLGLAKQDAKVEKISALAYNEIGQLITKKLGTQNRVGPLTTPNGLDDLEVLQTLNFKYNIRGWMTHLNDAGLSTAGTGAGKDNDLFGFELKYDQGATHNYLNGNIGQMVWQSSLDEVQRQYDYTYDGLNRLKAATYASATHSIENNRYNVENLTYDLNGNIQTLTRKGMIERKLTLERQYGVMDQLSYAYRGNQLLGVVDATNEGKTNDNASLPLVTGVAGDFRDGHLHTESDPDYSYDVNGNVITDKNKEIETILYNHLNLPIIINFSGDRRIEYTYDAAGIKLKKEVYEGVNLIGKTNYVGSFVYEGDNLQFIHTAEGRALAPGSIEGTVSIGFLYEYHYKDHLGNLRMAFREGQKQTYQATLEDVSVDKQQGFEYDEANIRVANPTNAAQHSAKLTTSHPLGMLRNVAVSKGDVVTVKVKGYYNGTPTNNQTVNWGMVLGNLGSTAGNANSGEVSSQNSPFVLNLGLSVTPTAVNSSSSVVPNGYLRGVFYNKDGQPITTGAQIAYLQSSVSSWQDLELSFTATERGYLQVYVANESDQEVYFDDMTVEHTPQLIVQENHYYPFGLELKGIQKKGTPEHRFKFNGVENEQSFGLNWNETHFRSYDVQLGRWHQIDPKAEKFFGHSPYVAFNNNPLFYTDPMGDEPPEGWVKHRSVNGSVLYLPPGAKPEMFEKSTGKLASSGIVVNTPKGSVSAFYIGKTRYVAYFSGKGKFLGYKNAKGKNFVVPDLKINSVYTENLRLDITFYGKGLKNSDGLQLIQTFYGTPRTDGKKVGKTPISINGVRYEAFVDGGQFSPLVTEGGVRPNTQEPYMHPMEGYGSYTRAGKYIKFSNDDAQLQWTDNPAAVLKHQTARFEITVVARNYMNTGRDLKLGSIKWGFDSFGKRPIHNSSVKLSNQSQISRKIISNDYKNYKFYGE